MSGRAVRAIWNGVVLAQSDSTIVVEGNHYFPPNDVNTEYLVPSGTGSTCPWKGVAAYWSVEADGRAEADVAWAYPNPKPDAEQIRARVAFWKGVHVEEVGG